MNIINVMFVTGTLFGVIGLIGLYRNHVEKQRFVNDILFKIKKEIERDYGIKVLFETRQKPSVLQFPMADDLNEVSYFIQEILKGFAYEVHNLRNNESLTTSTFRAIRQDPQYPEFSFSLDCFSPHSHPKKCAQGKNIYHLFAK